MRRLLLIVALVVPCAAQYSTFKLAVIPDTQYVITPESDTVFPMAQDEANYACANTAAMISLGDLTNDGGTSGSLANSWTYLYGIADACPIPYLITLGNHDYQNSSPSGRTIGGWMNTWDAEYGPGTTYTTHSWYKAGWPSGHNWDNWIEFSAGGVNWCVMSLQFYAPPSEITTANGIISANSGCMFIIVTHGHLYPDASGNAAYETQDSCTVSADPGCYGLNSGNSTDGPTLWANLISQHANIVMVLCGHDWWATMSNNYPSGSVWRQDASAIDGHLIPQMLSDYQQLCNNQTFGMSDWKGGTKYCGGLGYMRILTITPTSATGGMFSATTYSPWVAANTGLSPYAATLPNNNPAGNGNDINSFSGTFGSSGSGSITSGIGGGLGFSGGMVFQ